MRNGVPFKVVSWSMFIFVFSVLIILRIVGISGEPLYTVFIIMLGVYAVIILTLYHFFGR